MKRRALLIIIMGIFLFVATSCGLVADGPFGWVYTDTKTPISVGPAATGSKNGKACIHSFFGMIAIGDASIEAAMKEAGIKTISTVNSVNLNVFGTYTRQCTVVTGE